MAKIFTVSEINKYTSELIKNDHIIGHTIEIEGEVSEISLSQVGHIYFVIKDSDSQIKINFFKTSRDKCKIELKRGMSVVCTGKLGIYEPNGTYSFTAYLVKESGKGKIYEDYLKLRDRLEKEGLFSPDRKKPIPEFPLKIGVVTSAEGAVIRDIITTVRLRAPQVSIVLAPAMVQGEGAPESMIEALRLLAECNDIDTVIIGRGGGSFEDLNCFNDEKLVREIASYKIPIISAIGHETDNTLSDYVSDRRVATPTAAAQLAVPDVYGLNKLLDEKISLAQQFLTRKIDRVKAVLNSRKVILRIMYPVYQVAQKKQRLSELKEKLELYKSRVISAFSYKIDRLGAKLKGLSPEIPLKKGYSYLMDSKGHIVNSVSSISKGEKISMRLADGKVEAIVENISATQENENG